MRPQLSQRKTSSLVSVRVPWNMRQDAHAHTRQLPRGLRPWRCRCVAWRRGVKFGANLRVRRMIFSRSAVAASSCFFFYAPCALIFFVPQRRLLRFHASRDSPHLPRGRSTSSAAIITSSWAIIRFGTSASALAISCCQCFEGFGGFHGPRFGAIFVARGLSIVALRTLNFLVPR